MGLVYDQLKPSNTNEQLISIIMTSPVHQRISESATGEALEHDPRLRNLRNNSAGRKGTLVFACVGHSKSCSTSLFLFKHPNNVAVKLLPGPGTECL